MNSYFGDRRDAIHTNTLFTKRKPVHPTAENISPTKQSQGAASALPFNIQELTGASAHQMLNFCNKQVIILLKVRDTKKADTTDFSFSLHCIINTIPFLPDDSFPALALAKPMLFCCYLNSQPDMSTVHADLKFNKYKVT